MKKKISKKQKKIKIKHTKRLKPKISRFFRKLFIKPRITNKNMEREIIELHIKNTANIYHEITAILDKYKEKEPLSVEFIVEGTKNKPRIGIRYPGRKVVKRAIKVKRINSALWGNLFDFLVVPYINGEALKEQEFTFEKLLRDFQENKKENEEFWERINEVYKNNAVSKEPPKVPGIDSKLYLLMLKWIWIQEDFNYKLSWQDVNSPTRYVLETRTGTRTAKGAGRGKFFAVLILLKNHFSFEEVKKIIPLY